MRGERLGSTLPENIYWVKKNILRCLVCGFEWLFFRDMVWNKEKRRSQEVVRKESLICPYCVGDLHRQRMEGWYPIGWKNQVQKGKGRMVEPWVKDHEKEAAEAKRRAEARKDK